MTIIVATRAGIWADRRISGGSSVFRPGRKLARNASLIAAFCGETSACAKAMRAVKGGNEDPHSLAEMADGLVLTEDGVLWELWNKLAERTPSREAFAVQGSGHAEAQAFLSGAGAADADTVRRAIRYVSKVRSDCGDGIDGMLL